MLLLKYFHIFKSLDLYVLKIREQLISSTKQVKQCSNFLSSLLSSIKIYLGDKLKL